MIKDKYLPIIVTGVMIVALIVLGCMSTISNKTTNSITQPDYIDKLFANDMLTVNITISEENWTELLENATAEEYVNCDVSINGETLEAVGVRAKGNSSLTQVANDETTDRFSLKLKFNEYVKGQNLYGLKKLALNNMISDASYMQEYLSYNMFEKLGVYTPAYTFANITINDEPWGLYLAVETIEEEYLNRYYGSDYGNLYKPDTMDMVGNGKDGARPERPNNQDEAANQTQPTTTANPDATIANQTTNGNGPPAIPDDGFAQSDGNGPPAIPSGGKGGPGRNGGTSLVYTDDEISSYNGIFESVITKNTDDADKKRLISILKQLNSSTNLDSCIDIDEVLRYFAVNTFLVNLDSYAGSMKHNYYLYEDNGTIQILPWDLNLSFGTFQMSDPSKVINFPIDSPTTDSAENSPLIYKLLEVEEYKELYHSYLTELIDSYILNGEYLVEIERLDNLISNYVKNDATAFFTYEEYQAAVSQLKIYGEERSASIKLQLAGEQSSTEYGNMPTTFNLRSLGGMAGMGGGKNIKGGEAREQTLNNQNTTTNKAN